MPTPNRQMVKTIEQLTQQFDDDMLLACLDDSSQTATQPKRQLTADVTAELAHRLSEELEQQADYQRVQAQLQDTVLSLADYLNAVQLVVTETFAHSVWVKAEIRSLSTKGGHYYFELADKDERGKITASCRGNLWRGQAAKLLKKFEQNTGMQLDRGLNVLCKVSASFHPQYGFAVTILDIDPTYTLGDLAQQYQQMLMRLMEEGLLELNKSLPLPFDIEHVLVIAPENAAGLGDFRADADRLAATGACQFYYQHATFQGNHAPQEIREAIRQGSKVLNQQGITPDILVIIRGGGAVGDLAYLNDYELAALVAEQPIPVWVGIGHERDHVILDEVAQVSFDTPSKVIAAIRDHLVTVTQTAKQTFLSIEKTALQSLMQARRDSEQQFLRVQNLATNQLNLAKQAINQQLDRVKQASFYQLKTARQHTEQLRAMILLQHPTQVLAKGYAIARDRHDHIVTSVNDITPNEPIRLTLKDGRIDAIVTDIAPCTKT